ncbi:MAG: NAD(P)H-binding protein [Mycobacterium sp.]
MAILVTGATGNIGRRIVENLNMLGVKDIRALTTNPAKAALPESVTAITGYLGKPETLPAALDGVDRVYLAPLPDTLAAPQEQHFGAMYDLTGPVALSRGDIARQIGVGIGKAVEVQQCSRTEAEDLLRPVMGDGVRWYFDLFDGDPEHQAANDNVERLTGTPAESMARWAARNADVFGAAVP